MIEQLRLCKDCKHVITNGPARCGLTSSVDPVYGYRRATLAEFCRESKKLCGPSGKRFEPKEPGVAVPNPKRTFLQKLKDLFA